MISAIRPEAFANVVMDAGIFLIGFEYETYSDATALISAVQNLVSTNSDKLLGATDGGGSFRCTPTMRQVTMDGYRSPIKGAEVITGWDVRLTATMKEFGENGIQTALPTATKVTTGNKTVWTVRQGLKNSDYIDSVVWVGDVGDGKVTVIELHNVLNTSGLNLSFKDKDEGTYNLELTAHIADASQTGVCPCKIVQLGVGTK